MRVALVWPACRFLNGAWTDTEEDSFWVECTPEQAAAMVLPYVPESARDSWRLRDKPERIAEPKCFLVARDMSSIREMDSFYPYSNLWNAYSPFRRLPEPIEISDLKELQDIHIPAELRK